MLSGADRCWIDVSQPRESTAWSVEMNGTPFVIGRGAESQLRLDHDTVSRQHALLYRDPFKRVWIRDLDSRNGVKVNDQRVSEQLVSPGDLIRVGHFLLQIRYESTDESAALPMAEVLPSSAELEVSPFKSTEGSRIAIEHLSAIVSLGARLSKAATAAQRALVTSELLLDPRLSAEAVWFLRVENQRPQRPQMLFGPYLNENLPSVHLHVSTTLLREVIRTKTAQLATNEPAADVITLSLDADVRRIAAVAAPISIQNDFLDVLYVIYPSKRAVPEWLALTALVASQYSQSETAWRARRDLELHAVIEHDLRQASQIQKRLVPSTIHFDNLDIAISFEPCRWVGGDYVDVIPMAGGRVFLAVADVSGKGMQAALVASWTHTIVRAGIRAGLGLHAMMQGLHEHLQTFLPGSSFVTFFGLIVDPESGAFEYVNAGHPPALLLGSGGAASPLDEGSAPLGTDQYSTKVAYGKFLSGEAVVLYTDGWTDMPAQSGEPMGFAQFVQCVDDVWSRSPADSAADFVQSASRALGRFSHLRSIVDDRTFLIVRRR
jgi:serine phosphatase RsbU (regulator of sigma subunit)/pSer/pThr/pTyr-binding forkhead associated (FHA) protein